MACALEAQCAKKLVSADLGLDSVQLSKTGIEDEFRNRGACGSELVCGPFEIFASCVIGLAPPRGTAQAYARAGVAVATETLGRKAGQLLEYQRRIRNGSRQDSNRVERFGQELEPGAVDEAERGLEPHDTAIGGGPDYR